MRCTVCNRPLQRAAALINGKPVGPTCAKQSGIAPVSQSSKKHDRCQQTADMFTLDNKETK